MSEEGTYLDKILAAKRAELRDGPRSGGWSDRALADLVAQLPATRDFAAALRQSPRPRVIAEFKRASPSEGTIREGAEPRDIATQYAEAGASAMSVLTDAHFQGTLADLREVRRTVSLPIIRKDFILERSQIVEAREAGADAVLLIVAALPAPTLRQLLGFVHDLGMQALVEAHDAHELDRAMAAGAEIVGVNARDLRTFEVDLQRTVDLRAKVPEQFVYVAESGIKTPEDVERLRGAGVDAILVGTHFMRSESPGQALRDLVAGTP